MSFNVVTYIKRKMEAKMRRGIRKGKGSRRIYQEIQEQFEDIEVSSTEKSLPSLLTDIEDYKDTPEIFTNSDEVNEYDMEDVLRNITNELKDQLQKILKILNSNVDNQEQLCNIRKKVTNRSNYIQRINTKNLERESQQQLQDIKHIIKKILFTISIGINPKIIRSRELNPPHLKCKNLLSKEQQQIQPSNGTWNMDGKKFYNAINIEKWMLLSFSTSYNNDLKKFAKRLCQKGKIIGMKFANPLLIKHFTESYGCVENFVKEAKETEPNLQLAIVVLPSEGFHEIYAKVKTVAETEVGLMTQCVRDCHVLKKNLNIQLFFNIFQKINTKMGGINTCLLPEEIPFPFRKQTLIIGATCTPTRNLTNSSIAATAGSFDSSFSKYKSCVRLQQNKTSGRSKIRIHEIVDLKEMVKEQLSEFRENYDGILPEKIIFYRFAGYQKEFENVFKSEYKQIKEACTEMKADKKYQPSVTYIMVGKCPRKHFTITNEYDSEYICANAHYGIVIDTIACSDFFICSHPNRLRKSQLTRYTVYCDENKISIDDLQTLSYFLCHAFIHFSSLPVPCPIKYASQIIHRVNQYLTAKRSSYELEATKETKDFTLEMFQQMSNCINVTQNLKNTMYFI